MARITIEDCMEQVPNRFHLVRMASIRAKQLMKGARPLLTSEENKEVVMSLREIAAGLVKPGEIEVAAPEPAAAPAPAGDSLAASDATESSLSSESAATSEPAAVAGASGDPVTPQTPAAGESATPIAEAVVPETPSEA